MTAAVSFLSLSVPDKQKNKFTLCVRKRRLEMITLKVLFNYDEPLKYEKTANSTENFRCITPVVFYAIWKG